MMKVRKEGLETESQGPGKEKEENKTKQAGNQGPNWAVWGSRNALP